jgi:hypothetical protein
MPIAAGCRPAEIDHRLATVMKGSVPAPAHSQTMLSRLASVIASMALGILAACAGEGATDLSGEWTLTMDPDFRGQRAVTTCMLKQHGNTLTVRCGAGSVMNGSVKDQKVEWGFSPPAGEQYPAARWFGELDREATSLTGTWRLTLAGGDTEGKFSATRRTPTG